MDEDKMIEELRRHLKIAENWNWDFGKMLFCDGFLKALITATDKDYGFSGTDIYVTKNGERLSV